MGEVELGGKHAGGSPRRRGTFRDSTLIGTATSTSAAGPPVGDTPARGCRRAAVHNGPRAALTTTIAAGVVAVATGSVAYSTALQPLADTGGAPDRSQPQAAAPAPVPGPAAGPVVDRGVSDETRRPQPDALSPTTQSGHPSRALPTSPGARALPVAPPAVAGAPFEFTNPLLPGPPPFAAPGPPAAPPADLAGGGRPAQPGYAAPEAVAATPPAPRDDDSRYPARSLPVLIKSADDGPGSAAAAAGAHDKGAPAQRATAPVEVPAPAARPDRDRVGDPHHRTPIGVADWFARLSFRDPPPDPFTMDPKPVQRAAPADHGSDKASPAGRANPGKAEDKAEAAPAAKGKAAAPSERRAAAPAVDEKAPANDARPVQGPAEDASDKHSPAAPQSRDRSDAGGPDRPADADRPDIAKGESNGTSDSDEPSGKSDSGKSDSDKPSDKSDGDKSSDRPSNDKPSDKSDGDKPSGNQSGNKSSGDKSGDKSALWTSASWFGGDAARGGGFGPHR